PEQIAGLESGGDAHLARDEVGAVGIGSCKARIDRGRGIALSNGQRAAVDSDCRSRAAGGEVVDESTAVPDDTVSRAGPAAGGVGRADRLVCGPVEVAVDVGGDGGTADRDTDPSGKERSELHGAGGPGAGGSPVP